MKVGAAHLTYCTNIHPGESWKEVRRNIETHVIDVKERVSPKERFGIGLRLSAQAAQELASELSDFKDLLAAHDLYVFTINGFPYGQFHGRSVKADVYRPDWLEDERLAYTNRLADLLVALLPDGVTGTISTVPGCFKPRADDNAPYAIAARVAATAGYLAGLERRTGKRVMLALEPEPCCLLETIAETVAFFETHLAAPAMRRYVGVCLDACHAAVEFEDVRGCVAALHDADIHIAKLQLSCGLIVAPVDRVSREALAPFQDDVYLHQVVTRSGKRHVDLPVALASTAEDDEWRIHFHVPIFRAELGRFQSTQAWLAELLAMHREDPLATQLEVETYTWDVLPPEFRDEPIADAIARELRWVLERLQNGPAG